MIDLAIGLIQIFSLYNWKQLIGYRFLKLQCTKSHLANNSSYQLRSKCIICTSFFPGQEPELTLSLEIYYPIFYEERKMAPPVERNYPFYPQITIICHITPISTAGIPYNIIVSIEKPDVNLTILQAEMQVLGIMEASISMVDYRYDSLFCALSYCIIERSTNPGWQLLLSYIRPVAANCGEFRCLVRKSNGDLLLEKKKELDHRLHFCILIHRLMHIVF